MKKSILVAIIAAAILVPATVYAASPLFVSSTINEPPPDIRTSHGTTAQDGAVVEGEVMEKSGDAMKDEEAMIKDEGEMSKDAASREAMEKDEAMVKDEVMAEKDDAEMMMTTTTAKETSGIFAGAGDGIHNAEGSARVLNLEDGSAVLRLEDFRVTNGPDLYVYLSTDRSAADFVDLGRLKANAGNQNYELPSGIDLSKYDNVVVWCKAFSVYFGGAQLTAA